MNDRDRDLVERAGLVAGGQETISRRAFAELIVDLKDALVEQNAAATALSKRIERLNVYLLWVTAVIGALTLVQVATALWGGKG